MRLTNIANRLTLVTANSEIIDISKETGGSFSPRIQECYARWDELLEIAVTSTAQQANPSRKCSQVNSAIRYHNRGRSSR